MAAHHMISSTLLPAASRLTPSRQTAQHPFSFLQSLLNKLDVVINAPLRHVQLREASACCSPSGPWPVVLGCCQERTAGAEPAAGTVFFLFSNWRDIFTFCISFCLDIPLNHYWEEIFSEKRRKIANTLTYQAFTLWFNRYHCRKEIKLHWNEFSMKSVNLWSPIYSKHNKTCGRNMCAISNIPAYSHYK